MNLRMIYFDNAASSFPKPLQVSLNMSRAVNQFGANPGRSGHKLSVRAAEEIYACRVLLSNMFHAQPQNVIFTNNATTAINTVIKGLVRRGEEVVISDLEHNSVTRPLYALGARIIQARVDLDNDELTCRAFERAITPYTKLIICSHSSNVLGKIVPIKSIGELAKKYAIPFAVDAAQTGGCVDIDVTDYNIDFLCLAGHKGLYGPQGTGALIINSEAPLKTLTEGGTGVNSEEPFQPENPPERYESGTLSTPAICGLAAGIDFVNKKGIKKIFSHENELLLFAYNELLKNPRVILYTKEPNRGYTAVLPFNIKETPSDEVAAYLDGEGFCLRSGLQCAPSAHRRLKTSDTGTLRASFGIFNNKSEILQMCSALKRYNI